MFFSILLAIIIVYTLYSSFCWSKSIHIPQKKRIFSLLFLGHFCWLLHFFSHPHSHFLQPLLAPMAVGLSIIPILETTFNQLPWKILMKFPFLLALISYTLDSNLLFESLVCFFTFIFLWQKNYTQTKIENKLTLLVRNFFLFSFFFILYQFTQLKIFGMIFYVGLYLTHSIYFVKSKLEEILRT